MKTYPIIDKSVPFNGCIESTLYIDASGSCFVELSSGLYNNNCGDLTFKQYCEIKPDSDLKIITWEKLEQMYIDYQDNLVTLTPVEQITSGQFFDALEILPPMQWDTIGGIESFKMSERYSGNLTYQYARNGKKFIKKLVDLYDKSTWVNATDFMGI